MHNQPHTPLDELAQLREENQRLRNLLDDIETSLRLMWVDENTDSELRALASRIHVELNQ